MKPLPTVKTIPLPAFKLLTQKPRPLKEVTLYIKGFLAQGESADSFDEWFYSHKLITISRPNKWDSTCLGYSWESGRFLSPYILPIPILTMASGAYFGYRAFRSLVAKSPTLLVAAAAADLTHVAGRLVYQYLMATQAAEKQASELAKKLLELRSEYSKIRVVSHSLGCRHAVSAIASLPFQDRPDEIHLCAPAFSEDEAEKYLDNLAKDSTYLYFTQSDKILAMAYRLMSNGSNAMGEVGLKKQYKGLYPHDVTPFFDFFVHTRYSNNFPKFVQVK